MISRIHKVWLCGALLLGCAPFAGVRFADAQTAVPLAHVVPQLAAFKVVTSASGDTLVKADKVAPGDVIEYQASYANTGNRAAQNLQAILPIPGALEWVPTSASPSNPQASLDGKTFADLPLKRTVKAPDGSEKVVVIAPSELRFLRWIVPSLAPGQSVRVSARARLAPVGKATKNQTAR